MMNSRTSVIDARIAPGTTPKPRFLDGLAKRALLQRLRHLHNGVLVLRDGNEVHGFGRVSERCDLRITIEVKDPRFYSDIAFGGSIGAGEAYMADYWQTDDLTGLVRLLLINRHLLDGMEGGLAAVTLPLQKLLHWFNRNTHAGSRRNIAAHYDLGNDLFKLMLDETMMYSSAIFADPSMSLHEAQVYRLDQICRKLDLQAEDHLLEIGTGWGGLAIHAAKHYGCRVTTTTISREQYELAKSRVREAGVADRVTLLLEDYRNLTGQYDKLVSIEMIEAVGHQFYDTYFQQCSALLKPDGLMLLQAITIADQRYEAAKNSVDFIQRYIFPGSCIPSVTAMLDAITRNSELRLFDLEDIGPHYATTLRLWRENVNKHLDQIRRLGYSREFLRMWEFYLCYCEGGFIERAISDVHMLLAKPENRRRTLK
jgi:cyclopropane-fatty-acyl-phospholipid synthase